MRTNLTFAKNELQLLAHNRVEPTPASEGFNTNVFAHMYATMQEERRRERRQAWSRRQRQLASCAGAIGGAGPALDYDIEMILDSDSEADWEASDASDGEL